MPKTCEAVDNIQADKPGSSENNRSLGLPADDEENPFKLPSQAMGPVRTAVMIGGFLGLLVLGLSTSFPLTRFPEVAILFLAVVYFVWLAFWTRWK
jgi:hypothetical protein